MWSLRNRWSARDDRILPLPRAYPTPLPVPSLAVLAEFNPLSGLIYPRMHQTGDGRFRPNKIDYHSRRRYYRGGWHRPYPPLIPNPLKRKEKHRILLLALGVPLITVSRIVKVSRLLRPVGPGFLSQNPSPGYCSHNPYASKARGYFTPPTT